MCIIIRNFLTDSADLIVVQVQSCTRQISDFDTRIKKYKLEPEFSNMRTISNKFVHKKFYNRRSVHLQDQKCFCNPELVFPDRKNVSHECWEEQLMFGCRSRGKNLAISPGTFTGRFELLLVMVGDFSCRYVWCIIVWFWLGWWTGLTSVMAEVKVIEITQDIRSCCFILCPMWENLLKFTTLVVQRVQFFSIIFSEMVFQGCSSFGRCRCFFKAFFELEQLSRNSFASPRRALISPLSWGNEAFAKKGWNFKNKTVRKKTHSRIWCLFYVLLFTHYFLERVTMIIVSTLDKVIFF